MSRPLLLHVSALSEAEYARYQSAYDELAIDGPDIGVREARGWLRGRGFVDGLVIDKVCFCYLIVSLRVVFCGGGDPAMD